MNVIRKSNYKKRYGAKKIIKRRYTRIARQPRFDDIVSLKCECYGAVQIPNGSIASQFQDTTQNYYNIPTLLNTSGSFTDMITRYSRYRINGMSIRFDSCILSNVTTLTQLPLINIAFYPQAASSNLGDGPLYNDKKGVFNPACLVPQTKYWRFPENFFTASSGGYGTWNDIAAWATLTGQLSVYNPALTYNATATTVVGMLRVTFYIQFASKNI